MAFQVVHVKRRGAKTLIDLTKTQTVFKPAKAAPVKPPEKEQQQPKPLYISPAPDGPLVSADLPEKCRKGFEPVRKPLIDKQIETLERVIQRAGEGHPKTLGLRLVLAASEDEFAAAWPIGALAKAFHVAGHPVEGEAVHMVAYGCRVSRYGEMAATALALLNQKIAIT